MIGVCPALSYVIMEGPRYGEETLLGKPQGPALVFDVLKVMGGTFFLCPVWSHRDFVREIIFIFQKMPGAGAPTRDSCSR